MCMQLWQRRQASDRRPRTTATASRQHWAGKIAAVRLAGCSKVRTCEQPLCAPRCRSSTGPEVCRSHSAYGAMHDDPIRLQTQDSTPSANMSDCITYSRAGDLLRHRQRHQNCKFSADLTLHLRLPSDPDPNLYHIATATAVVAAEAALNSTVTAMGYDPAVATMQFLTSLRMGFSAPASAAAGGAAAAADAKSTSTRPRLHFDVAASLSFGFPCTRSTPGQPPQICCTCTMQGSCPSSMPVPCILN